MNSLRTRIFVVFCALLVALEVLTLTIAYVAMRDQIDRNLQRQLEVGREVFLSQFESRRHHLSVHSQIIARDYGLLSTLHEDARSLQVALDNHRNRVGADLAVVTDLEGTILADTERPDAAGTAFAPSKQSHEPEGGPARERQFLRHGGNTYQLVTSMLLAPNPVGRIYLGFEVDEGLAEEFQSITALDVSFISIDDSSQVVASTVAPAYHDLLAESSLALTDGVEIISVGGDQFASLAVPLALDQDSGLLALLQASRGDALAAYRPWWQRIAELSVLFLLAAFAAAWVLARGVVRPVRRLSEQAEAIAAGDYEREFSLGGKGAGSGEISELVNAFRKMQSAIAEREASIRYNAYHDSLTKLVNRHRLEQLIDECIRRASVRQRCAVVTLGLSRFRDINDTLGYHVGDRLLRDIARRLEEAVGTRGIVARLGGDEFGILYHSVSIDSAKNELQRLTAVLSRPFNEENLTLHIGFTMGMAAFPDHGRESAVLLRHSDTARLSAKDKRIAHEIYAGSQDRYSLLRVGLLGELQAAMDKGDISLYFQPQLNLETNAVESAEALLRWKHPTYGMIPPQEFVPMVERAGNIHVLTMWVIEMALRQMAAWSEASIDLGVSVNISAHDLYNENLLEGIKGYLAETGMDPSRLKLELTENAVVEEEQHILGTLRSFHELGLTLSIDDYGTGYSSLAQLKKLPFDELKIDKSFLLEMDRDPDDEIIVRSTIELGHLMGLSICAEGVESQASLELLRKLSCDKAQGYHIARPMPAQDLALWLKERRRPMPYPVVKK